MIDKKFAYHKPSAEGLAIVDILREAFTEASHVIEINCPTSREKSVAMTHLETAAMWAIKSVISNDPNSEVASNQ